MSPFQTRSIASSVRAVTVVALCCFGIWESWKIAWADHLYREDTADSIRSALRFSPDAPEYYLRLSQWDPDHAMKLLEQAVSLDRYNAEAEIELGLTYESEGDNTKAERFLLDAYQADRTYVPRWTLANFYFRHDQMQLFWKWARIAAAMPSDDMGPLFQLCWRAEPDAYKVGDAIINNQPQLLYQYIDFLLKKNEPVAASSFAERLIQVGTPAPYLAMTVSVVDQLIASSHGTDAQRLWYALIDHQWVKADKSTPNNQKLDREPLQVQFDWALPSYSGLHSTTGPSGLNSEFDGSQPEDCAIAAQAIVLPPGKYSLQYSYQTSGIPAQSGIHWQILDEVANTVIATSPDLSSEGQQRQDSVEFTVPPSSPPLYVRLGYQRELGTSRISGNLMVHWIGTHREME